VSKNLFRSETEPLLALKTFSARLSLIVVIGFIVRMAYLLIVVADNPLSGDSASYHLTANLFADGMGFTEPFRHLFGAIDQIKTAGIKTEIITPIGHIEPTAGHPPLWTLFLGMVSFLGGTSIFEHQIASVFIGSTSIIFAGLAGRKLCSERVGLISAFLTATYPFIWINDGLLAAETISITATAATILVGLKFTESPDNHKSFLLGITVGLAALCRAELLLYLLFVPLIPLIRSQLSWKKAFSRITLVLLSALLIMSPWIIRNILTFKETAFLSNGAGTVLVQANCDRTYYGNDLGYWNISCGQPAPYGINGELLDESERDKVVRSRALTYIGNNQDRLITTVIPARIGRTWSIYKPIQQLRLDTLVDRRPFNVSVLGLIQYYSMVPFALAGLLISWRRRLPVTVIAIWIPIATLTSVLTFGNIRYRSTAEISLILLTAVTLNALTKNLSFQRFNKLCKTPYKQLPGGSS
tara:strand:- start:673 stop:2085 length:1413 start_codon:yes stop_codon:yes gene_type:complete